MNPLYGSPLVLNVWSRLPIFGLLLFCACAFAGDPCEEALLRPVHAMIQLTKRGLEKQILKREELARAFAGDAWVNPFAVHVGNSEALAMRKVFDLNAKDLKSEQKAKYREMLAEVLTGEEHRQEIVREASQATRAVLAPQLIPFPDKYANFSFDGMSLRWWEGRPVAIGTISRDRLTVDVLLDPMNPEGRHVLELERKQHDITTPNPDPFEIFTEEGQTYVLRTRDRKVFKLPGGEETYQFNSRLRAPPDPLFPGREMEAQGGGVLVPIGDRNKFVAAWNTSGTPSPERSFLEIRALSRYDSNDRLATGASWGAPLRHSVEGHELVSWAIRRQGIQFVDLSAQPRQVHSVIPVRRDTQLTYPIAYAVNGEWRAMFLETSAETKPQLMIADLKTGTVLRTLEVALDEGASFLSFTEVEGKPFAQMRINAGVLWIDLTNETSQLFPTAECDTAPKSFVFRGSPYLTWGTKHNEIAVMDVGSGSVVRARIPKASRLHEVLPFVYRGQPFAFVDGFGFAPVLVEMMRVTR